MNNLLLGLRLATNDIRKMVVQKQMESGLSNEAVVIMLKDLLVDYESATTNDYVGALAKIIDEKKEEKEDADS